MLPIFDTLAKSKSLPSLFSLIDHEKEYIFNEYYMRLLQDHRLPSSHSWIFDKLERPNMIKEDLHFPHNGAVWKLGVI